MTALLMLPLAVALMGEANPAAKYRSFLVREVRHVWGADESVSTFAAQIRQESGFDETARSTHAAGLAQFTPPTVKWMGELHPSLKNGDALDWRWSIRAMVRYDHYLHQRIPARPERWRLTLRSYNGGLGWIQRELKTCGAGGPDCCRRFRSGASCRENIEYPDLILTRWKPRYAAWDR